ncbi:hypothetical protein COU74_02065 [Candidatus Peregrinibacteria bacterium CG10_big_fil_rev_8_21_14_0_10_36_19]|nr:MAG: hypothetical protein COU74_02065 [Candidatus Peregrinibacteria bacterium CG10_big_fil_rev_8_21_14_0_10_36_19]
MTKPLATKYVIYARRSTDADEKQQRSLGDQISECKKLAQRLKLKVIGAPIVEKLSAQKPGARPEFERMMKMIDKCEINGIISWHPDRLSRNMIDGGRVIHMVDDGKLLDMQFCSYTFINDASGKMLLGITFALSKHYSDKLSQDVKRGMVESLAEGKSSGQYKPGYRRDDDTGLYFPDNKNFKLIQRAWKMKLDKETDSKIVEMLNNSGYKRVLKKKTPRTNKEQYMSESKISKMFGDSFYYGLLKQKDLEIDLFTIYDFKSIVTEEEFISIQKRRKNYLKEAVKHDFPFRGLVICNKCDHPRVAGASKGKNNTFLYYRCDNEDCEEKGKSIRAKEIINAITSILDEGFSLNGANKEKIEIGLKKALEESWVQAKFQYKSLSEQLKFKNRELFELTDSFLSYGSEYDKQEKQHYKNKKELLLNRIKTLKTQLKKQQNNLEDTKVDLERTLNTLKKARESFEFGDASKKDKIAKLIFLNIYVEAGKVASIKAKEPFDELLNSTFLSSGGPGRT